MTAALASSAMVTPSASVVVPTYQRRVEVVRAVESVLAQTRPDFELIVVDDGSTDGTEEALANLDPRLRCLRRDHRGVAAARNSGIREARSDVLAFLDSDNVWLPDHLSSVLAVLEQHPDVVLVSTSPGLRIRGHQSPAEAQVVDALPRVLVENFVGYVSCIAVRRQAVLDAGGFDESLTAMEDAELWVRLAARGPFALLERRTVVRARTPRSLTEQGSARGLYGPETMLLGERAVEEIERLDRPDKAALAARAHGREQWGRALIALREGDERGARPALEQACTLLPELSHEEALVTRRVSLLGENAVGRLGRLEMAARLWPDRRAPAAVALRSRAIAEAVRCGRPRTAAALLVQSPLLALPRILLAATLGLLGSALG